MGSMGVPAACAMRRLDDRLRMHSSAVRRVDGSICTGYGRVTHRVLMPYQPTNSSLSKPVHPTEIAIAAAPCTCNPGRGCR